ncbi:MAG TPA: AI-2E family transporter [Methylomirabilota bacterium]|jgi:predicted PurR-regulated permease PerM
MSVNDNGWFSRERVLTLTLLALTVLALYLCYLLVQPFLPALSFALALVVVTYPMYQAIARYVRPPNLAAGLAVGAVGLLVITPIIVVGRSLVVQLTAGLKTLQAEVESGHWREVAGRYGGLERLIAWLEAEVNPAAVAGRAGEVLAPYVPSVVVGSAWTVAGLLMTLFILFFFFRDGGPALGMLRSLIPLSQREADEVFGRIADTIHASIFGSLTVAFVQGALGGFMFWVLGLPAPVFWGFVMALLALIPMLGTFLVWGPAAIFLALGGQWGKAVVLVAWGAIAIGFIDNLLYPFLVRKRMRLHTLPVFFAILGGVSLFGTAGVVVGPVILSVTDALIDVWRRRTEHGRRADAIE